MNRSLQLQILSFLAALAALGAIAKPNIDTGLFACAFVLGTMLMQARDRVFGGETGKAAERRGHIVGEMVGVIAAWGMALLRSTKWIAAHVPPRLTLTALIMAATVPSAIFVVGRVASLRARRRRRVAE